MNGIVLNYFLFCFFFLILDYKDLDDNGLDYMRSCPSPNKLFPETVRRPLRDLVTGVCPRISSSNRLRAVEFQVCPFTSWFSFLVLFFSIFIFSTFSFVFFSEQASNADHMRSVYDMGITMVSLGDGKVQLLHSFYNVSIVSPYFGGDGFFGACMRC